VRFTINQRAVELDVEPEMPLLWALRDELGLTGTKYGCGVAYCGACTVLVDGQPTRSCVTPMAAVEGKTVTTIEAGNHSAKLARVQEEWVAHQVPQCGYCQPGQIMAAVGLLLEKADPTDAEIDASITNVCRCGTYTRIRAAIHAAAKS
jgi:aerobic-type carbon monoxide dehydrogenase small subunit (CoxS/CutS family)